MLPSLAGPPVQGYPRGMAQLIDSPTEFVMTPMQIDTWNRNTVGPPLLQAASSLVVRCLRIMSMLFLITLIS